MKYKKQSIMKTLNSVIFAMLFIASLFTSCSNPVEELQTVPQPQPGDRLFPSPSEALAFVDTLYIYGIHTDWPLGGSGSDNYSLFMLNSIASGNFPLLSCATDEAKFPDSGYDVPQWNWGTVTPASAIDPRYPYRFEAIARANTLLRVAGQTGGMEEAETNELKAVARFIRALNTFEMFKRYGGMPVIDESILREDYSKQTRNTLAETIDFIVADCDEAAKSLPAFSADKSKITQGATLALKSRALLYAASSLFNSDAPYLSGDNNELLCYGNTGKERWSLAAQAAAEVLQWASTGAAHLIDSRGADRNYRASWEEYDNNEIILSHKSKLAFAFGDLPWAALNIYRSSIYLQGMNVTFNFVKKYEKQDGTQQQWSGIGAYDLQEKLSALDRRFKQSICYNMAQWNRETQRIEMFEQSAYYDDANPMEYHFLPGNRALTGFWICKHNPAILDTRPTALVPNFTLFQLNEIYLNYAEAVYEYYENPDIAPAGFNLTAREAVNIIRKRSGQPEIQAGSGAYSGFRELLRNERAIELAFDNHRFWDIRRWMIAGEEGVAQGNIEGIRIKMALPSPANLKNPPVESGYSYTPYVVEQRVFHRKMYLHPLPQDEVNKGYLTQNPGY
jgi:hypothetical protein